MVIRAPAKSPVKLTIRLGNRKVVDRSDAKLHQSAVVKLPILIAVGPEPVAAVVMKLIDEGHRDPIAGEGPHFLDEPVVKLTPPFAGEECHDLRAALDEFSAIAPFAVFCVGQRDL